MNYLTDMPEELADYGLCKTLLVRREIIHIKHIFTELFLRKTIDLDSLMKKIDWSIMKYMEYISTRIRHLHLLPREYRQVPDTIVKHPKGSFFPTIELYSGLNNVIVLDFDGVVTENSFRELYNLCLSRCKTVICSANPGITNDWFLDKGLRLPSHIYSCKGMVQKINQLSVIALSHNFTFYVDNEEKYLEYAWVFGIQTYQYKNKQIKYFTKKSK